MWREGIFAQVSNCCGGIMPLDAGMLDDGDYVPDGDIDERGDL